MKILTSTSTFAKEFPSLLTEMEELGFRLVLNPWERKLTELELLDLLEEHNPIGLLAGTEPITQSLLERANGYLRVISRIGVGWDNVDRDAAAELGIRVYRTPGVLTQAVAELTLGLMIAALRWIPLSDRHIRQGQWQKQMGRLLQGKVVGVIGFGDIGKRVGELVNAFEARVIYYDPQPVRVPWAQAVTLPELLAQADIITIHASGKETILGPEELKKIGKPAVILVNTARGGLIDEAALYHCLVEGQVGFACLDVFENEPYSGPLSSLDNVILTTHIGSYAREARLLMERTAVENLLQGLREVGAL